MTKTSKPASLRLSTALGCCSLLGGLLLCCWLLGCSDGSSDGSAKPTAAQRGRQIYENVCIICHNGDPTQPGSLGPQVAGASLELIEARVLRGEYPPGYTPLRPGQSMPKYEYLAGRLDDVAAYLQQDRLRQVQQ